MDVLGIPPIRLSAYVAGKLAMVLCWASIPARLQWPEIRLLEGQVLDIVGIVFLTLGLVIVLAAFLSLGASTRIGLPRESTILKTGGLYRYSRNPMYIGLHLTCLAAVVWTMNPVVLLFFAVEIIIHHRIVLAEEQFLEKEFGDAWRDYGRRVRRYM